MMRRWVLAALASMSAVALHAQDAVFRARTDVVAIDVTVMDGNRPVTSLTLKDFVLTDDGVPQTLIDVGRAPMPLDITLTIDISGSVTPQKRATIERAIEQVGATLKSDDRYSVVSFANRIVEVAPLHHPPFRFELSRRAGSGTSLIDAILLSLVTKPAVGRRQLNLILTDGIDTTSFFDPERAIETARYANAQTSGVIVRAGEVINTDNPGRRLLDAVSAGSGGQVVVLNRDDELKSAFLTALEEFRTSYLLTFSPTGVSRKGWHPVVVTTTGRSKYTIRARQGYWFSDR